MVVMVGWIDVVVLKCDVDFLMWCFVCVNWCFGCLIGVVCCVMVIMSCL